MSARTHIWRNYSHPDRFTAWCGRLLPVVRGEQITPSRYSDAEHSDCCDCLQALRDVELAELARAGPNANLLTHRLDQVRRQRRKGQA